MFYILHCHIYRGKQIQEVYVIILTFSLKSKKKYTTLMEAFPYKNRMPVHALSLKKEENRYLNMKANDRLEHEYTQYHRKREMKKKSS